MSVPTTGRAKHVLSTGTILALADDLRRQGHVSTRGRPRIDGKPTLLQALRERTSLSIPTLKRILAGRPRHGGKVVSAGIGSAAESAMLVAHATKRSEKGSHGPGRGLDAIGLVMEPASARNGSQQTHRGQPSMRSENGSHAACGQPSGGQPMPPPSSEQPSATVIAMRATVEDSLDAWIATEPSSPHRAAAERLLAAIRTTT